MIFNGIKRQTKSKAGSQKVFIYIHESGYAEEGANIGEGMKIMHFCCVENGAVVGKYA